jgi:hypothetical protein
MKGLELPINMIIIIAIALLVIVVVSAFFLQNFSGNGNSISIESAFSQGCNYLNEVYGCNASRVNDVCLISYRDSSYSLGYACKQKYAKDTLSCTRLCGCTSFDDSANSLSDKC